MALTDRDIKNHKSTLSTEMLFDGRGLYLKSSRSGLKTFVYRYKKNEKIKWISLGHYPTLSLAAARTQAQRLKNLRLLGVDPYEDKKNKSENEINLSNELRARPTFQKIYEQWIVKVEIDRKDKGEQVKRNFERDILPFLKDKKIENISRSDLADVVDKVVMRGSMRMANLTLTNLKTMFNFAEAREIINKNPAHLLKKKDFGGKEVERDRFLTGLELIELSTKLPHANLHLPTLCAIYLTLATSCRIGELTNNFWQNVNFENKTFYIPIEISKNRQDLTINLSNFALKCFKFLHEVRASDVFLYPNADNTNCIYEKALGKQLRDRQLTTEQKILEGRSKLYNSLKLSGGKWTFHDLRRTSSTIMGSLGVNKDIIEKCLNHVENNKMVRIYHHYEHTKEMKDAWNLLGEHLEGIFKAELSIA